MVSGKKEVHDDSASRGGTDRRVRADAQRNIDALLLIDGLRYGATAP